MTLPSIFMALVLAITQAQPVTLTPIPIPTPTQAAPALTETETLAARSLTQDINYVVKESNNFQEEISKSHPGFHYDLQKQSLVADQAAKPAPAPATVKPPPAKTVPEQTAKPALPNMHQ